MDTTLKQNFSTEDSVGESNMPTTTFADSGVIEISRGVGSIRSDDYNHDYSTVSEFLQRPALVNQFLWTTADLVNTTLLFSDVKTIIQSKPAWREKLRGYNLMRGDVVIRVQVNCNPFQQGKLLLNFFPAYETMAINDPGGMIAAHRTLLSSKRQLPCVEIDCRDSAAILKLPYINTTMYYDITNDHYDWGRMFLDVLAPLKTGASGETTVYGQVFMHFENIELAAPIYYQGPSAKRRYTAKSISKNNGEAESNAMTSGPISHALMVSSKAAATLSEIPLISEVAGPASWFLEAGSKLASYFGWSKPLSEEKPLVVAPQFNRYSAVCDGPDMSIPMSLKVNNKVKVDDSLGPTNEDEMSFSYLKKVSTILSSVPWSTTDGTGTVLSSAYIGPTNLYESGTFTKTGHTATYGVGPPIYYLSKLFTFWRGSFDLTIKIAKTDFHSGRIMVVWSPTEGTAIDPTLDASIYSLREIIDIKSGSEFKLNLPYIIKRPYMDTSNGTSGRLTISVLTELRAPETASSSVDILLYWSGGDDFELEMPVNNTPGVAPFTPQMGDETIIEEGIGGLATKDMSLTPAYMSMGEQFSSVKQLLNRYTYLNVAYSHPSNGNGAICFWPWSQGFVALKASDGSYATSNVWGDAFDWISKMYLFHRGSARVMINTTAVGTYTPVIASLSAIKAGQASLSSGNIIGTNGLSGFVVGASTPASSRAGGIGATLVNQGVMSFTVPFYCEARCGINSSTGIGALDIVNNIHDASRACLNLLGENDFSNYSIYRSFGDEFQFGYFIGCPPIILSYV